MLSLTLQKVFLIIINISIIINITITRFNLYQGRVAMWENGKKYFEKTDIADLPATYERNRKEIDIVSAG